MVAPSQQLRGVATGAVGRIGKGMESVRSAAILRGRRSTAGARAGLIGFLLSEEAAYMTEQAINFTGGLVTG